MSDFLEYSLTAELNLLFSQKLPCIYCILSAMSSLTWFLFIRQGAYQEGVFSKILTTYYQLNYVSL